ncbi:hypothetical protein A2Z00_03255 [Candidatus Gottesmanbacteria bacterium RBG_13_45_10]|uniref:Phosphoribosyltransferase domain-containing protein n=1 Tax=Candidatus Gottesmanbacteria bacterium RBG_13_45_10 TaxID=1798370 RepID=A0A1F5ZIW3_9BACT|nr:MAG: hypothetical protein A2Z00_03255 [Candidatus Gottesmanbacteria bacterium RBG_13_45_10]
MVFTDRTQAGKLLASKCTSYAATNVCVVGLARGGVVVAHAIASKLALPLDVVVIKKIPAPGNEELALGAVAPEGIIQVDWRLTQRTGADEAYIQMHRDRLTEEIKQKTLLYRKGKKPISLFLKTVLLVDDGAATGATMEAAIKWAKSKKPAKVVAVLPVAPSDTVAKIAPEVDTLIVGESVNHMQAVGEWYKNFSQVSDENVIQLLNEKI